MIWIHRGKSIPLEVYHGVPEGWYASDILAEHARLAGKYDISGPEATEPGAPSWMPARKAWLQYRETLYRVADGVGANDSACIELAIRYIELRHIGSYSGFVRSLLSRRLKHATLTLKQKERLHQHFRELLLSGEHTVEFNDYFKLWRLFITEEEKKDLFSEIALKGEQSVKWVAEKLQANNLLQSTSLLTRRRV
jgi:hypothetical protein